MLYTIKAKFLIGFFVIFSVFFLILNQWVTRQIESANQTTVTNNLKDLKNNSNGYIRQSFLTHHFENDTIYFEQMAEELGMNLQYASSSGVGLYSLAGEQLYASDQADFPAEGGDLLQALQGKTAYTITLEGGQASVLYAYPIVIDGTEVGIVRFAKDFSSLYEQSGYMQRTIFLTALAVFAAAFLFSYILSRHITVPVVKLTQASTEVMNGNLNVRLAIKRKDELGKLAVNFGSMLQKLRNQFAIIEKDRDRLEELYVHRKRFFDNVTHELKTPLTTIMGYAEIIRADGVKDPAIFEKGMNHIVDESKRLHDMVLKLLEMSKASEGHESHVTLDAAQLLAEVCDTMTIKAQRYKKTIRCVAPAGLLVHGRSDRLRQLFINLLDNAIKYSEAHSDIAASARLEGEHVRIVISNQGEPISPEHLDKIFEPYYRAGNPSKESESAGLGLSISKSIVDEHQGRIRLTSDGGATNVSIDLPFMKDGREEQ
ncbi:sensor histidine kinase [Paenibacillus arenilitoris]|uniref:histidine kinase n=1 Tax=Paenibacillus arenilitoris TaxID=2772299 RepID=A0A927CQ58_9BACL|nr:HAMP domain-containing sensor histidine kinase [Paenibacillus arenilitoris]MBD2871704.1 HAMP domain-containing histidine kinase [Paenibacillus arenilitoris]